MTPARSLALAFTLSAMIGAGPGDASDIPELAAGIRQVQDGEFEAALLTLDGAIQRLRTMPDRTHDLATAYVHLGVAYLGLGQEGLATAKFRQALRQEPGLQLTAGEFSARTLRVFAAAREAELRAATLTRDAKKSKGKGGLILLALGGVAAAGTALAIVRERENTPPTASIAIAPEGQGILNITRFSFTATASDAENDPLSYAWDFGDGQTASGTQATHLYTTAGEKRVVLTVRDGLATTTASAAVTIRDLSGTWRIAGTAFDGVTEYRIAQPPGGTSVAVTVVFPGDTAPGTGSLVDPRDFKVLYSNPDFATGARWCNYAFSGTVNAALQSMGGTLTCVRPGPPTCTCDGQQQPVTLTRQ